MHWRKTSGQLFRLRSQAGKTAIPTPFRMTENVMTRNHALIMLLTATLCGLSVLPAAAQDRDKSKAASVLQPGRPDRFELDVAKQISAVARFDGDRFFLASLEPREDVAFNFYDEAARCERAASFSVVALKNVQGSIAVGICVKDATRVRDAARKAERRLSETLSELARSLPEPGKLTSTGWKWASKTYNDGWEAFSFPVVAVGHGILWTNTIVLWSSATHRAVIVQADLSQLCDSNAGHRSPIQTPLCDDTAKALTDIALAVARTP